MNLVTFLNDKAKKNQTRNKIDKTLTKNPYKFMLKINCERYTSQ